MNQTTTTNSKCDRCGDTVEDIDAGFSPGVHGMTHGGCGGTWCVHSPRSRRKAHPFPGGITTRFQVAGLAECIMTCVDFEREPLDRHEKLLRLVGWLEGAADLTPEQAAKLDRWLELPPRHRGTKPK